MSRICPKVGAAPSSSPLCRSLCFFKCHVVAARAHLGQVERLQEAAAPALWSLFCTWGCGDLGSQWAQDSQAGPALRTHGAPPLRSELEGPATQASGCGCGAAWAT